ncbi:MAG: cysteine synthase A, partial [Proteobacteria bacterium]|nr:cysteine synthase A [Pseudomonadota bacterium]
RDAEARGTLRPGGVVVEGTAGNTGIGLAIVANALGYRAVVVIPETQSQEKKDAIRIAGAELREVPAVPYADPNHYVRVSERLAAELAETEANGAVWANQFDNVANRQAHHDSTGREIWEQTGGNIDAFICSVGTGGTLGGVGMFLKEQRSDIVVALADPHGASLYSYYTTGELKAEGSSITEGIGQSRITANLADAEVDMAFRIADDEMLREIYTLVRNEGWCVGGSSGVNLAGARQLAARLGPGKVIVTVLADHGARYQSRLFNPAFLRDKGLPQPDWMV